MKFKTVVQSNHENGILGAIGTFLLAIGGQTFAFLANLDSVGAIVIAVLTFGGPILQVALKHRWALQKEERDFERLKRQKESLLVENDALSRDLVAVRRELRVYKQTPVDPDK